MAFKTTDLSDDHGGALQVAEPIFLDLGGRPSFSGPIRTVQAPEDNSLVRQALEQPGDGAVLIVDGGGSKRCALLGDQLAALAVKNGWSGIVVHGCVRDVAQLRVSGLGVRALAAYPVKSVKQGRGERDVVVSFAGVRFTPGHHVYVDEDGVVVAAQPL